MTERDALRLFLGVLLKNGVSRHISPLAEAGRKIRFLRVVVDYDVDRMPAVLFLSMTAEPVK